ncbi:MAG: glycosyl hydrolase, partial [Pedobacter sp.]|nr:glycosyl hydrolase [Chitinophagaceae bacterium]
MKLTISISSKQYIRYYLLAFLLSPFLLIQAQETVQITSIFSVNSFPIINNNKAAIIYIDSSDAPVVTVAARAFQQDVELISNVKPLLNFTQKNVTSLPIIIGTRNHSKLVDQLVENGKLSTVTIDGKWESFIITVIKNPLPNVPQALVIVGSDARGTAFGVFEVSKQMGVSPW